SADLVLDEFYVVHGFESLREPRTDVAAARDHDASHRGFQALHLAHHESNVFGRGDEEDLVVVLDDRIALGLDALPAAVDGCDPSVMAFDVRRELLELLADEGAAFACPNADETYATVGEVEHLQRAGMLDQAHHMIRHELLRADRDVDTERTIFTREQFRVTRVVGRTNARDASSFLVEQGRDDLACDDVNFVAVRERDDNVRIACTAGIERARIRAVARNSANVDAILQIPQHLLVHVDDGDLVRLFAREVIRRRPTDLAGTEDDDLHRRGLGLGAWGRGRKRSRAAMMDRRARAYARGGERLPFWPGPHAPSPEPSLIPAPSSRTRASAISSLGVRSSLVRVRGCLGLRDPG